MINVYPLRLKTRHGYIVARFPEQCEDHCRAVESMQRELGYLGYDERGARLARTRDERQCRGCGRWGIFGLRAITAGTLTDAG